MRPIPLTVMFLGALLWAPPATADWPYFYTDQPGYAPGDVISIHATAPAANTPVQFRLVRLDRAWTEWARTTTVAVDPQPVRPGSFVEFPGVDLGGMAAFTLEGWLYPTLASGDDVAVAGQLGASWAAAGILLEPDGRPAAYVSDNPIPDAGKRAVGPNPLALDVWHHLAASWDGLTLVLYVDGQPAASRPAVATAVALSGLPFRLGARAEAPGDLTGVVDGRMDSWALWPRALSSSEVLARMNRGSTEPDPIPPPSDVLLYAGFEDGYGAAVVDGSSQAGMGLVINHGTPRVAGRLDPGVALRLNHDQCVGSA